MFVKGKIHLPILHHQNYTIDYEITQRRINQKNIILHVKFGRVIVSAPKFATREQIEVMLKKHVTWIIKRLEQEVKISEIIGMAANLQKIFYRGSPYQILTTHETDNMLKIISKANPVVISTSDNKIYVHTLPEIESDTLEMNTYLHEVIYRHLFCQAKAHIPDIVMKLGASYYLNPRRVVVKEQKSRWGSCSTNGSIYMNWRLIQAPDAVLQYVAIHELAHLQEHNHSAQFWQLVESMMPAYREQRSWLKENGNSLFILHPEK
jgi:predicted metal-dependent hydrolase